MLSSLHHTPHTRHALLISQNVRAENFIGTKLHPSNLLLTPLSIPLQGSPSDFSLCLFQTALSKAMELIGGHICGKQICFLFLLLMEKGWECDWWMCVCVICTCRSAVHSIYDTIAFRLELNLLTVSFIQDAGTYCSGVTFDPIHSICSILWHMWSRGDILWRHAFLRDLISPIVLLTVLSPFVDKESRHTHSHGMN